VKIFMDSSVLLAACGSTTGASRETFRIAESESWEIISTPYVISEITTNILELGLVAVETWNCIRGKLQIVRDILTIDLPVVFPKSKDRPILFSAFAWADVLLTLDRKDFDDLIGRRFYDLPVLTPAMFVEWHRKSFPAQPT